jgi:NAD(P)H dehydrogenase (quinone)
MVRLTILYPNSEGKKFDKDYYINSYMPLPIFAPQHIMLWISSGILPKFENDRQLEEPNGLGSYLGRMTLSDNSSEVLNPPMGLQTAELFGQRIAQITNKLNNQLNFKLN